MPDYQEIQEWVKAGRRQAEIILGGPLSPTAVSIHVYDFDLEIGQNISSISEIDLLAKKKRQIDALKRKVEIMEGEVENYGNAQSTKTES